MPIKMFQQSGTKPKSGISHTIAIAAGKGGVGKSTVTVNLALALKRAGYSVGILDADLYGPSLRIMLPEEQMPQQKGDKISPALCQGIKVISMAYFRTPGESTAVRAPIANGLLSQFINQVDWGVLDFLLVDFPPGTGDIQITLSQQANLSGALLVTTPQEVAIIDVRKAAHLFSKVNLPIIGIVENMSYYADPSSGEKKYLFGKGGGARLSDEIGAPLLGEVPIDPEICRCGDLGRSLYSDGAPASGAAAFMDIAEAFVAHVTSMKRLTAECLSTFTLQWKEKS